MAKDAEIKLVLNTKEAIQEAKDFGPRLEKMLNADIKTPGFDKLRDGLRKILKDAGVLTEKLDEAGNVVSSKLAKGFRADGLKDYESRLEDISKTVNAITENEKALEETQKKIALLSGKEKGVSVKSLQGSYAAAKDPEKKEIARIAWENAKQQLVDAQIEEGKLLAQQKELNATFDTQYSKISHIVTAMDSVSGASDKARLNVEAMEEMYNGVNAKVEETATSTQTASANAQQLDVHTKGVAESADNADAAIDKVAQGLGDATSAADNLKDKVAEASTSTEDSSIHKISEDANEATSELQLLIARADALQRILQISPDQIGIVQMLRQLQEAERVLNEFKKQSYPEAAAPQIENTARAIQLLKTYINDYNKAVRKTAVATTEVKTETTKVKNETAKAATQARIAGDEGKNAAEKTEKATKKARSSISGFSRVLNVIKSGFSSLSSTVNKVRSSFDRLAGSTRGNFKHMITNITKYVLGFRSLFFLVRRLRRYIGEGIKNMAQFNDGSNHVNASLTRLSSSLLYLKNAWATAFSPILQFVTPWLEALIDKLAQAGNAFSRFLGSLLGQSKVFQAVKISAGDYADNLDKAAGSAGGAAKKQKQLNDRLAAFDDLNVLGVDKDPNGTGGGGGGGLADQYEPDPNKMFKIVEVVNEIKEKLKEMWDKADFSELGENLAKNLKSGLEDLLTKFPEIQEIANKVGKSIGTFLTGFTKDPTLFEDLGHAIAEGLDTLGQVVAGFFEGYEKGQIGTAIASFFQGLFGNFDWNTAGTNLGNFVDGLFKEINALISGFPTETVVTGLTDFLKAVLGAISWETVGDTLSIVLVTAFNIATLISENLPTEEVEKAFIDFLNSIKWGDIFNAIAKSINASVDATIAITEAVLGIIEGILGDTSFTRELGKGIGSFLANLDIVEIMSGLTELLIKVIWEISKPSFLLNILVGLIKGLGAALGDAFQQLAESGDVENWWETPGEALVAGLWTGIENALIELFNPLLAPFGFIWESFCSLFEINSPSKVFERGGEFLIEGLLNGINNLIATVMEPFIKLQGDLATKWTEIKISASEKWNDIKNKLYEKAGEIKSNLSEAWNNIKSDAATAWVMLRMSAVEAFTQLKEAIKSPINGVISVVESMVNRIINGINSIITKINTIPDIKFTNPFTGTDYKLGFDIPKLSNITIPRLAQGAVIPPNREFMAVLGDQSHGTNIEAPLDTIKQAVAEVVGNNGNQEVIQLLQQLITVVQNKNLVIGDKEIGKANARYGATQSIIRGTSF